MWQEPAGASDQIQALDLGIFGIQKKQIIRRKNGKKLNPTSKEIMSIVDSWRKVTTPHNIVSAFNQAGIYIECLDEKVITRASVEKARAVRGIEHVQCENEISGKLTQKILSF